NVAIHLLAGLVLFGLVRRTLLKVQNSRFNVQGSATGVAFCVALLWTVHPLQTEAVTYVIQRAESLMGLFYLLTLYCFARFASEAGGGRQKAEGGNDLASGTRPLISGLWLLASVFCCLLGMASKEVMVSAPLMVFLYDRTFVAGTFRGAWKERPRFYLALASTWLLLGYLVFSTGGNRSGTVGFNVGVAWWAYWLTQFQAIVRYLWLTVWPHPLIFEYGTFWVKRAGEVVPHAVIVAGLLVATVVALKRRPALGFLGAWFFVVLAPSSLAPGTTQMIVEHRMYLSLAAAVTLVVLGLYRLLKKRSRLVFVALAFGCGFLTERRNEDYSSAVAIWKDTVEKRPGNSTAHNCLGEALAQLGRTAEAIDEYREALRLYPDYAEVHSNLGNALIQTGEVTEAVGHYREALRLEPKNIEVHTNLGNVLAQQGRLPEAIDEYRETLRLQPGMTEAHYNLGNALAQLGRMEEAVNEYREALRHQPDYVVARYNLANALFQLGRLEEAAGQYQEVLQIQPENAAAHNNLGNVLFQRGQLSEAVNQ
ncbi:MAG: tetratricopeptide repeat protein, partial [Verrucomicrobiota bacterium]|nr:tetratricopeptide repeat protein [Verrucomicrobiota bacterium]